MAGRTGVRGQPRWLSCVILAVRMASAVLVCAADSSIAGAAPRDPAAFTRHFAGALREGEPNISIQITAPLRLTVKGPSGDNDLYLDQIYSVCSRDPDSCESQIKAFIGQMSAYLAKPEPALTTSSLRVIVRTDDYMAQARQFMASHGGPIARPLPGGFWLMLAQDRPTTIAALPLDAVKPLGLAADQALDVGARNMAADVSQQVEQVRASRGKGAIIGLGGSGYGASLFAFPDLWAPVARKYGGQLLVAVPANDAFLCADGRAPGMAQALAEAAQAAMASMDHPLSATVFRWTPHGWEVVTP